MSESNRGGGTELARRPAGELAAPVDSHLGGIQVRDSLGNAVSILDVDWHQIFADEMHISYPRPYREKIMAARRPDGTVDTSEMSLGTPERYLTGPRTPDIKRIITDLDSGMLNCYEFLLIAIPDPDQLEPADRTAVQDAILRRMAKLVKAAKIHDFFEMVENVAPVWFSSFEIIEAGLPKIMRHPYMDVLPYGMREMHDPKVVGPIFEKHFPDEVDELLAEVNATGEWFFTWMLLSRRKTFPRKRPQQPKQRQISDT